ncbi:MAG: GntR family transcriptional regulator [Solirubrobacteraceae bacterium]|nr:GntR family transcriptional regulator [Solirubrobacteraceae bacterium]
MGDRGQPGGQGPDLSLPVRRVAAPLREQVVEVLREAILDFRLKPGQRLIERELIEQTGVSRTTIREVLRQLAAEGLVTTIPQKGAIVVVPTAREAADLYEVRACLEGLAGRRFVERADGEQVARLRAAFAEIERLARAPEPDIKALLQAKDDFYDVLFEGAGNRAIRSTLGTLHARVRMMRATSLTQAERMTSMTEEIRAIVEAAEARDADAMERACEHHVEQAARHGLQGLVGVDPTASEVLAAVGR